MGVNRVDYGENTIIDITDSTVTEENLLAGMVAYGADGERIVGKAVGGTTDYEALDNKPSINGYELIGNKTAEDLDIYSTVYVKSAGNVRNKIGICNGFKLTNRCYIQVLLAEDNSYDSGEIKLNINNTGDKTIYINDSVSSSINHNLPAGSYIVYYNGVYNFRTDGRIPNAPKVIDYISSSNSSTDSLSARMGKVLDDKINDSIIQKESMPMILAKEYLKVYQYIGETNDKYTNGYFYKCVGDDAKVYIAYKNTFMFLEESYVYLLQGDENHTIYELVKGVFEVSEQYSYDGVDESERGWIKLKKSVSEIGYLSTSAPPSPDNNRVIGTLYWKQWDVQPNSGGSTYEAGVGIDISEDNVISTETRIIDILQADYDELSNEEKMDKSVYYNITDAEGGGGEGEPYITFIGTHEEWDALTQEEKNKYDGKIVTFTDDYESDICSTVAECVASENVNDVAGASAVKELNSNSIGFVDTSSRYYEQNITTSGSYTADIDCYCTIYRLCSSASGYGADLSIDNDVIMSTNSTSNMPSPLIPLKKGQILKWSNYTRGYLIIYKMTK